MKPVIASSTSPEGHQSLGLLPCHREDRRFYGLEYSVHVCLYKYLLKYICMYVCMHVCMGFRTSRALGLQVSGPWC